MGYIAEGSMSRHFDRLNLTPEQKTKVQQLHNATKAQMDAVFTPEQRQKLAQIKAQRQNRPGKAGWNLIADQKAKLKAVRLARSKCRQQHVKINAVQWATSGKARI
jgi:hypothetical protein